MRNLEGADVARNHLLGQAIFGAEGFAEILKLVAAMRAEEDGIYSTTHDVAGELRTQVEVEIERLDAEMTTWHREEDVDYSLVDRKAALEGAIAELPKAKFDGK